MLLGMILAITLTFLSIAATCIFIAIEDTEEAKLDDARTSRIHRMDEISNCNSRRYR